MTAKSNIDSSEIKYLLFDLGGVLLNIDYTLTENAFKSLGLENYSKIYTQFAQNKLFDDFEKGLLSAKDFIDMLSSLFKNAPRDSDLINAWNAMLLDFPLERLEMLRKLKEKYTLFLLSNTNEIHFSAFNDVFKKTFDLTFSSFFNKDYYSHQVNMRKPEKEIFQTILDDQNLNPKELLFIDDSQQHIKGADQLGIKTLLLEEGDDVVSMLNRIGILA